jgi:hypothetical protein
MSEFLHHVSSQDRIEFKELPGGMVGIFILGPRGGVRANITVRRSSLETLAIRILAKKENRGE